MKVQHERRQQGVGSRRGIGPVPETSQTRKGYPDIVRVHHFRDQLIAASLKLSSRALNTLRTYGADDGNRKSHARRGERQMQGGVPEADT